MRGCCRCWLGWERGWELDRPLQLLQCSHCVRCYAILPPDCDQAKLSPGVLSITEGAAGPFPVTLALTAQPTADVSIRWGWGRAAAAAGDLLATGPLNHLLPHLPATAARPRSVTVPLAAWANASLAEVAPASLAISPADWATPQTLTVSPSPSLVDGTYHISLLFT